MGVCTSCTDSSVFPATSSWHTECGWGSAHAQQDYYTSTFTSPRPTHRKLEPPPREYKRSLYKPTALLAATDGAPCWRRLACGGLIDTPAADARRRRHRWTTSNKTPTNRGTAIHGTITCITSVPLIAVMPSLPIAYTSVNVTRSSFFNLTGLHAYVYPL